jgi:predicted ArsR family transcriptional regulator
MPDEFLSYFGWITGVLKRPLAGSVSTDSPDYPILRDLRNGWGTRDTAELLAELDAAHGPGAAAAVERFLAPIIARDWKILGEQEARPGTEIDDFIRVLWTPLTEVGFEYRTKRTGDGVEFAVTRCPIHELAGRSGLRDWLYHLACATDFHSTPAFSSRIEFSRTCTLIRDGIPCNHAYRYRKDG